MNATPLPPVRYRVSVASWSGHRFGVELLVPEPGAQLEVSLPVWIPGSYLVREFSQHLLRLEAWAGDDAVAVEQTHKNRWVMRPPAGAPALRLCYEVYAHDASVRTAWLDQTRGFFNPTSLCLRVHGREAQPHRIDVLAPEGLPDWQLATALTPDHTDPSGFGSYVAQDYDELADSPFEMGPFWSGTFEVRGVPHRWVVSGAPRGFDGQRLLQDAQRICDTAVAFWHDQGPPPFDHYLFMLHASADGYGGLEHRCSTALICQRSDLPLQRPAAGPGGPAPATAPHEGYVTLLGLIAHEYFHAWNVKRLRPRAFARYDYDQENHTDLLWFFEGFTSYYDDLLVLRAGLIDEACYLGLLSKTINQVLQTPGRHLQSVAQASFEAWTKYYRVQPNTPNATVSYYSKGALVALCLDLTLRAETDTSLDEVMRRLYARCHGGPMETADVLAVLADVGGRSYAPELAAWVYDTHELPLRPLLEACGVEWHEDPAPLAQQWGLRVSETEGLHIRHVARGSAAEAAGLAPGDEWLGVECPAPSAPEAWRVRTMQEVSLYANGLAAFTALVARDGRLLRCPMAWPDTRATTVRLVRHREAAGALTGP
jgi:predicted metalloprotease with PDZ domain